MSYSPTETLFDFHVAPAAPEQVRAWQGRVEYLLDESTAGAASFQAVDEEISGEHRNGSPRAETTERRERAGLSTAPDFLLGPTQPRGTELPGGGVDLLRSEIAGLLDVTPDQVRLFPEAELPSIAARGGLDQPAQAPLYTPPIREVARSQFIDSGEQSRLLYPSPAEPKKPEPTGSLLSRPAPALGRIPPATPPPVSLTAGQVRYLDEEISQLHEEVKRVLATRRDVTGHALSLLREAREILLAEPHRLGRAEHNLGQVRSMLERAREGRRQSSQRGFRVLLYLAFCLAVTVFGGVALFLYGAELSRIVRLLVGNQSRVLAHLHPFLWVTITGSLGAVSGAILGFLAHIRSGQDFDRQHVVRFAVQPVMGLILGVLLYLLFSLLFSAMQLDLTARPVTRALPVVLALPVGLWQEWIYASLYRMSGFLTLRPRRR